MTSQRKKASIVVRNATLEDVPKIAALVIKVYKNPADGYTPGMLRGQISSFPEGQFVVEYEGEIVGYSASFIVKEELAMSPHDWIEITGNGYAARHDPEGDWLYGMDVSVDPDIRRQRIGQRLYDARKQLCEEWELKGIVFGGRMPGWRRKQKTWPDPEDYVRAVKEQKATDPVIRFHIRAGFEPIGVLRNYLPDDADSGGNATHMVWRNPYAEELPQKQRIVQHVKEAVRVATVQVQMRAVKSFEEFISNVEYFVDVCSDRRADFVVFPELFTLQLLAFEERKLSPAEAIEALTRFTPRFIKEMRELAISYNINIIGGSHPTRTDDGDIQNVAYVFLRDGSVHAQEKIHPTPDERHWWNIKGGDSVDVIPTDCGPIGVLICYDAEFPELARRLTDEGARILFTPFCTDSRQGYLRVRYCCHARCIENQLYVVTSGCTGNLPNVENMDINYAQSAILTPCDYPFAREGIAAEIAENVEAVVMADLDLTDLAVARSEGTVRNLRDRRFDLYRVKWNDSR
ncbi:MULTISPECIES: bifunctional GNAT family N-acetyltransferase/carbon-nitrogen hydrolase family protein [Henriciella]|jgi:predicted amidohydrolase/GNAT superfamily N-acetyltransferase|uniref:Hydrolase YhcX n=1 Tax=Henriciella pelagia TaxID=1977912 RepID=A0ABQ1JUE1_9PROT|nr:bifunctional GNAT family N-acetyltransferase/carbon-nitrogen hydrolase family protein [Henriciella pelagia]GGB74476.1 hydrolase YhcX [Henriciella pelagia]